MPEVRRDLVERLAGHRTIGTSPRHELEWLAAHGELRRYAVGELLAAKGAVAEHMIVILDGHGAVYIDRGGGRRKFMEWGTGDVTGYLPFSRMPAAIGEALMDRPSEALLLHRNEFPGLIRECPTITAHVVHTMVDRVRHFASTDWQDDKMVSLGRLAAGLSHELNNPASAAARSAQVLAGVLARLNEAAMAVARARLTDEQQDAVEAFAGDARLACLTDAASAIERADREDEIGAWLETHDADTSPASTLAEAGYTTAMLDELARAIPRSALGVAVQWIAAGYVARSLVADVERATHRIHELVTAVKRFTYMDRPTVAEPTDVVQALVDTIAVLGAKARDKSVSVSLDAEADLPAVNAFGGELNQVWSNLIENALDAVEPAGHVAVSAKHEGAFVVVRVVDDGPGIPAEDRRRVFDPFFTTKPQGQGTGLGLDIARRAVRRHDGSIELESRPGRTEFRVTLPISAAGQQR